MSNQPDITASKFLALVLLLILAGVNQVCLYWFAFGLWPTSWKSWGALFVFGVVVNITLRVIYSKVEKDK